MGVWQKLLEWDFKLLYHPELCSLAVLIDLRCEHEVGSVPFLEAVVTHHYVPQLRKLPGIPRAPSPPAGDGRPDEVRRNKFIVFCLKTRRHRCLINRAHHSHHRAKVRPEADLHRIMLGLQKSEVDRQLVLRDETEKFLSGFEMPPGPCGPIRLTEILKEQLCKFRRLSLKMFHVDERAHAVAMVGCFPVFGRLLSVRGNQYEMVETETIFVVLFGGTLIVVNGSVGKQKRSSLKARAV